jgi:hypothetical protein
LRIGNRGLGIVCHVGLAKLGIRASSFFHNSEFKIPDSVGI